ncbi:MAG: caspase family protein [Phaeodactylibacter sp.]|uniref:caspase family protein n=1 Tax=Phaeodactylibacter sp. TaxID=1940289 RepID=UPI0032EFBDDC
MHYLFRTLLLLLPISALAQAVELGIPTGHTGIIYNLRFSQDGKTLFSAGEDASLMRWDVETGKLLKSSVKAGGAVLPGAIASPDLQYIQYRKGWQDDRPLFFTFRNAENRGLNMKDDPFRSFSADGQWGMKSSGGLARLNNPADSLPPPEFQPDGFTPDGRYFYKVSAGQLELWDAVSQNPAKFQSIGGLSPNATFWAYGDILGEEVEYQTLFDFWSVQTGLHLYRLEVPEGYQLKDIARDGSFVILTNEQGQVRKYNPGTKTFTLTYPSTGRRSEPYVFNEPPDCRLSPDGQLLANGGDDGTIYLQDATTGQTLRKLQAHHQVPAALSFSADGKKLNFSAQNGMVHTWDLETCSQKAPDAPTMDYNSITLNEGPYWEQRLSEGGIEALTADKKTGVRFEVSIERGRQYTPVLVDLDNMEPTGQLARANFDYHTVEKAIFAPDGSRLLAIPSTELKEGTTSFVWDVPSGQLQHRLYDPEESYALCGAFSADGRYLLLGTWNRSVHLYDLSNGQRLHTYKGHRGKVRAVAFSPTGKYIASGAEDGMVKIWRTDTHQEVATLILIDQKDWIVLSPKGLFDASPDAMRLLYYLTEDEESTEIIELEQLKARYYEPGLLQKALGFLPEPIRSVEGFTTVALYPKMSAEMEGRQLRVSLKARSGGIGRVAILINGKEIAYDANPARSTAFTYDLSQHERHFWRHPDSTNRISLYAFNAEGWLRGRALRLSYDSPARARGNGSNADSPTGTLDPKMYVVAVGTSDYSGESLDLKYATQDATAIARTLALVGANLFANGIEVHCLTTATEDQTGLEDTNIIWQYASKANVEATIASIRQKAKAEDVLLVYLSGHGKSIGNDDGGQFYYLTHDIANTDMIMDPEVRARYTISSGELTEWINSIPALKQVLVIDACNSGQVVNELTSGARNLNTSQIRALDRMQDRTGMFILSGSAADKVSYEASEYGQGLLTYSLLKGILGLATTRNADGEYVDVMALFQHARDEVPRLAASIMGVQTPTLGFPADASSFDIGIVKYEQALPVGQKKPVLIRTTLLNEQTLKDDLRLMPQLENTFRRENEEGSNANYLYIDVNNYPGAYALRGLYTVVDDQIRFSKIRLFKGDETYFTLDIPTPLDPERAVREIERAVRKTIKEQ